ncbi:MAG: YecR family lipoprotein [Nitrosomonadaceae bacterium]
MMKFILAIMLSVLILGCAVTKVPVVIGGSRADGTVDTMYTYGTLQNVTVDMIPTDKAALSICKRWGYTDIERFPSGTRECGGYDYKGGCVDPQINHKYQCVNESKLSNE